MLKFILGISFITGSSFALQNTSWQNFGGEMSQQVKDPNLFWLSRHQALLGDGSTSEIYPLQCKAGILGCDSAQWLLYGDSTSGVGFSPVVGSEYLFRQDYHDQTYQVDMGGVLYAKKGPLDLFVDGRIYTESHSNPKAPSLDGEYQESQTGDNGQTSAIDYTSYSRVTAAIGYHSDIGLLGWRLMSPEWGPAILHPLTLSGQEIPFGHFVYEAEIGPFRAIDFWGRLSIDGQDGYMEATTNTRSLYAHRYEWDVIPSLTIGMSELLILFNMEEPEALLPMVPLFMIKTQGVEDDNNGEMSFDFNWRSPWHQSFYGEFLIDDMSSPTALFSDYYKNRWGVTLGSQWALPFEIPTGLIAEYCRIEPWVYTHYTPNTVQAANKSLPLGESLGPNSQQISLAGYSEWRGLGLKATGTLLWKGTDLGSGIYDTPPNNPDSTFNGIKQFLGPGTIRDWLGTMELYYSLPTLGFSLKGSLGFHTLFEGRMTYHF